MRDEAAMDDAAVAFLAAVQLGDVGGAEAALAQYPAIAHTCLAVAAVLGLDTEVRRLIAADPRAVRVQVGDPPAEPLVWLCYSPFHGDDPTRDEGLLRSARALLDGGADPNARDGRYGIAALFAVTGERDVPAVARLLLEAGARPDDGESVFHAAERYHTGALALLLEFGVDLNRTGDWGNTPLYFLLQHHDVAESDTTRRGFAWLLDHGADPNVRSGREGETALHAAARRGQHPEIVRSLIEHGADVDARRSDGRTAWVLATRQSHDRVAAVLEASGAVRLPLSDEDELIRACTGGDVESARTLGTRVRVDTPEIAVLHLMQDAARTGGLQCVDACMAAGFSVDVLDDAGASALHHACIVGDERITAALLGYGADVHVRDHEHDATPLGWASFGAEVVINPAGRYAACAKLLRDAGAIA